ncbi:MAG: peptidase T [Lachnospiraceae bacterium]|nr:peptidase T [Lachnospiraceae bacterium]
MNSNVVKRFLNYIKVDTRSDENSTSFPSTEKQKNLGKILAQEMTGLGISEVYFDEELGYVYGKIPANDGGISPKTIAFIAHMDTAPDISGEVTNPQFVENYQGQDILLNEELGIKLTTKKFPELKEYVGKTLITTDGTTLLGADDKAGIAEIMTMAETLLAHPEIKHGPIALCFTPDEEVGGGVDHINLERLGADYGYTVDGGALGEIEYENFNASSCVVKVQGVNVHPGEAKNKMKNAALIAMEFEMMLPRSEKPEYTCGYEGFYHLTDMQGNEESAKLNYIIRDHDKEKFEIKKAYLEKCKEFLNQKYGEGTVTVIQKDSYYNMKEKVEPEYFFLVEYAKMCMEELEIVPRIQPIRGGTDGARLSYMGLPCPNLCAGGHNFHGRYEYVCVESMEKIAELLVKLATKKYE